MPYTAATDRRPRGAGRRSDGGGRVHRPGAARARALLFASIPVLNLASHIGIWGVPKILADLHQADYLARERVGRRNHYSLNLKEHLRYPTEAGLPVRLLIDIFIHRDTRDPA
jgi:hypothetical protein|uniref:hypothetical protein n=1 Tax=Nonomuraea sp. CA-252377 TaxID=3240003 RepID=UPI003F495378